MAAKTISIRIRHSIIYFLYLLVFRRIINYENIHITNISAYISSNTTFLEITNNKQTMIEIIKEKPLKSTTRVEGLLVRVTGGEWYAITKYQPSRNPWFGRAVKSTSTGRIDFNSNAIFVKRYARAPELEELKTILVDVLNGAEAPQDKPSF